MNKRRITKSTKPTSPARSIFRSLAAEFTAIGDVESPVFPPESWDMLKHSIRKLRKGKPAGRKPKR